MTTSTFDSLAAMRALVAAGVDRNQAEAHAEQLGFNPPPNRSFSLMRTLLLVG